MSNIGRPLALAAALIGDGSESASAKRDSTAFDCYCGSSAACPVRERLTPQERANCSHDKRQTAQTFYRDGLGW